MINNIAEIYKQLSDKPKLIQKWKSAVIRRIKQFARNISKASPFLDKPQKSIFGVRSRKKDDTLTIYGTSPNAGRMKGFDAPVNEWLAVNRYFRVLRHGKWRTIHKVQKVKRNAGVPLQDVAYYGTSQKPDRFYGIKNGKATLAYGKTQNGLGVPVYAKDSFADWLMTNHRDELENIILECGRDILADLAIKGGLK